ncbi:MAG: regulatory protein RecX, partial [Thermodesulfobacteriota bacterium]
VEDTVLWLREMNYLDDKTFAREWSRSRRESRNWGSIKITSRLREKGIAQEIIDELSRESAGEEETGAARRALDGWLKRGGHEVPLEREGEIKAFRFLNSRGFPASVALSVLKESHTGTSPEES